MKNNDLKQLKRAITELIESVSDKFADLESCVDILENEVKELKKNVIKIDKRLKKLEYKVESIDKFVSKYTPV